MINDLKKITDLMSQRLALPFPARTRVAREVRNLLPRHLARHWATAPSRHRRMGRGRAYTITRRRLDVRYTTGGCKIHQMKAVLRNKINMWR